jgi:hypothetical protein
MNAIIRYDTAASKAGLERLKGGAESGEGAFAIVYFCKRYSFCYTL